MIYHVSGKLQTLFQFKIKKKIYPQKGVNTMTHVYNTYICRHMCKVYLYTQIYVLYTHFYTCIFLFYFCGIHPSRNLDEVFTYNHIALMSLRSRSHVMASVVLNRADHLCIHNHIR